jgi:hypothetical protein
MTDVPELTSDLGLVEMAIYEQECIRIVFRAPAGTRCKPYLFDRSLAKNATVEDLMARVSTVTDIPFVIVDGHGNTQHLKRKRIVVIGMSYPA